MNNLQLLHAQSIARHIREHAERLASEMRGVESIHEKYAAGISVVDMRERLVGNFEHSVKEMRQVFADMLGELGEKS